ncbi:MAG TPA: hypothetical protein ENH94_07830 [Phycisphaerales bacterium]|nr:hypothetical protein [Phycisphaerales bacterium]
MKRPKKNPLSLAKSQKEIQKNNAREQIDGRRENGVDLHCHSTGLTDERVRKDVLAKIEGAIKKTYTKKMGDGHPPYFVFLG